jgi:DNA-binding GntR family transcriptional regulator
MAETKQIARGAQDASVPALNLRDQATRELRLALMTGRFEPGQRVSIRGLAAMLGMSMTPVREAVARLAAERALIAEPNRWMSVPLLSPAELRELRDLRIALEGLATERAAQQVTPELVRDLVARDAAVVALRPRGTPPARIAALHRLHFTIYAASRMPALVAMIEGLWLRSGPYANLLFPGYAVAERGASRATTLRALVRGEAAAARRSMEADIGNALGWVIGVVEGGIARDGS